MQAGKGFVPDPRPNDVTPALPRVHTGSLQIET
jgi:hypothetical protein